MGLHVTIRRVILIGAANPIFTLLPVCVFLISALPVLSRALFRRISVVRRSFPPPGESPWPSSFPIYCYAFELSVGVRLAPTPSPFRVLPSWPLCSPGLVADAAPLLSIEIMRVIPLLRRAAYICKVS